MLFFLYLLKVKQHYFYDNGVYGYEGANSY